MSLGQGLCKRKNSFQQEHDNYLRKSDKRKCLCLIGRFGGKKERPGKESRGLWQDKRVGDKKEGFVERKENYCI